jgi:hypothetical protein
MKTRLGEKILPFVVLIVGGALIYLGLGVGAGPAWAAGGVFFIILGLSVLLLSAAASAEGKFGIFLRSKFVSLLIFLTLLIALVVTVILGIMGQ